VNEKFVINEKFGNIENIKFKLSDGFDNWKLEENLVYNQEFVNPSLKGYQIYGLMRR